MLKRSTLVLLWLLCALALPVSAQSTFTQGAYDFETCGADCTFSGTWLQLDNGAQIYAYATGGSDYVEFDALGKQLVIYRAASIGFASMEVCVNAGCSTISNNNTVTVYNLAYIAALTGAVDTIRITGDFVYLDQFLILDEASVPTATILPSSTPAPTATPQPTWTLAPSITPAFTATPQPIGGVDSSSVYATLDTSGQMTRFDYVATAGSVHISNLVLAIFFSVWAMFLLDVLVLRRGE